MTDSTNRDSSHRMQDRLADMMEATRLTAAGRLQDATNLLQRGFTGTPSTGMHATDEPTPSAGEAMGAGSPRTIDLVAERVETGLAPARPAPERPSAEPRDKATPASGPSASEEAGLSAILPEKLRKVVETVTRGIAPVLGGLGKTTLNGGGLNGLGGGNLTGGFTGGLTGGLAGGLASALSGAGLGSGFNQARAPLTAGGSFTEHSFSNAAGGRDYKLFVPSDARPNLPLVVMLHGCTQSPDDFAAGTGMNALAEAEGFLVAYPAQTGRANAQRCWNWFQPNDQDRGSGEAGIIAGLTRAIVAEHRVDPARVYIAGLSAGGAAAVNIARVYPDLYAAVGIHSGLAAGCARDVSTALTVMRLGPVAPADCTMSEVRVPTIVFHGESDGTVNPRNGEQALAQAGIDGLRPEAAEAVSPGGLPYTRTRYADGRDRVLVEGWIVRGLGHAWSGGSQAGSYTDPRGPDASRAMLDFFRANPLAGRA
ncbi:alpha/beta hydrolase family esterase [Methylobacterium sp. J-068]|uniref:extracellular catalytic domain type 1 short-chain-length polyhydroxyalkanoate depolymerase n=1 Tax=Methylobacterium sp. J-068 TaxID=2836649 RepID=UPI001FBAE25E|nr:PHB depolymerase family esterase [Methylobacterium sp. J-068]MCJ2034213.1 PHB depolymerase family esterase [Methylobacterium sp. J-068]